MSKQGFFVGIILIICISIIPVNGQDKIVNSPVQNVNNVQLSTIGISNDSAYFNGNSYLELNRSSEFFSQVGTVSAWIKTSSSGVVFSAGNTNNGKYYFMLFIENGSLIFYYFINQNLGTIWRSNNPGVNLMDNSWHQVTWESDGSTWSGFIDGQQVSLYQDRQQNDGSWFGDFQNVTNNLCIGVLKRPAMFGYFTGNIDEFVMYNQILSHQEINSLYISHNKVTSIDSNANLSPLLRFTFDSSAITNEFNSSTIPTLSDVNSSRLDNIYLDLILVAIIIIVPSYVLLMKKIKNNQTNIVKRSNSFNKAQITNPSSRKFINSCVNCGSELMNQDKFCQQCGSPIIRTK